MKRKSGQHRPDKRKSQRLVESFTPVILEGAGFTQLELLPNQAVIFVGSAVLEVTAGCIAVYGALITPESGPIRLHAPARCGRALQLAATAAADPEPPCQPSSSPVLAVLQPMLGQRQQEDQQHQKGYTVTDAAAADALPAWQVHQPWAQAVGDLSSTAAAAAAREHASSPLCVAVTGSKGSGKSAFARLLVNSLLSQGHGVVAYLDLDPGQPEFTPPGLLSLQLLCRPVFGPAHLQHQQPLLAFFQGDTSPQSEPGRYIQAVQALLHRYSHLTTADLSVAAAAAAAGAAAATPQPARAGAAAGTGGDGGAREVLQLLPPLVINTPGWITGLGLDLLAEVLRCAGPTHVVQLQTSNQKRNLPTAVWWLDGSTAAGQAAQAIAAGLAMPVLLHVQGVSGPAGDPSSVSAAAAAAGQVESSAPSGDTAQTQAAVVGQGSTKGVSAAAARNMSWLTWAERAAAASQPMSAAGDICKVAASAGCTSPSAAEDFAAVADALAAAVPRVASMAQLHIELLHAQVPPDEMHVALNGAVVGLSARSSGSSSNGGCTGSTVTGRDDSSCCCGEVEHVCQHYQQGSCLPECLGLGLVRSVDGPRAQLHLVTDLPDEVLQRVDLLQLGKLELPDRLLDCRSCASPYQGLFCLTSAATGAGQIRSRNNLLRSSQLFR